MVKVMLKYPVGGQLNPQGGGARALNYLEAAGTVTTKLREQFDEALKNRSSMSFVSPDGDPFLVPAKNIAYLLERKDPRRNVQ